MFASPHAFVLHHREPLAVLIGMLLDQQVPMEWAFAAPKTLKDRLGGRLDAVEIAAMPVAELEGLAQSSNLQWVQSNPERVAEVQAAIAAEPRPVHVPRERPPLVMLDEGPLILVETRKDLAQLNMPFEAQQA